MNIKFLFIQVKVIVAGGCNGWCKLNPPVASAELYDPATDTWTKLPDMPYPISSSKMEQVNGYPTIIGGVTEDFTKKSNMVQTGILQSYDPDTNRWFVPLDATEGNSGSLKIPRSNHAVLQIPKYFVPSCFI